MLYAIEKTDVVTIVSAAWEKSFSIVKNNHTVISECGWGPLNYVLLDHPEIASSTMTTEASVSQEALSGTVTIANEELNMQEGITGTLINKLVDMKNHEQACDTDADLHTAQRISTMKENLKTTK